jgi:hypothetical protein
MRRTSSTLQPYDRATGTELSQKQQEDCQAHYLVIKAYIDSFESDDASPVPWTRKKLRCPTTDLLDAIERLADVIRHEQRTAVGEENDTSTIQHWIHDGEEKWTKSASGGAAVERYQQAVNLLHELVSRLADTKKSPLSQSSIAQQGKSLLFPNSIALDSSNPSSHASTTFSNAAASRASELTGSSARTASSRMSNDLVEPIQPWQDAAPRSEEASFEIDPFDDHLEHDQLVYSTKKERATYDWVLEYLRGGWQFNSPATAAESTISPFLPLRDEVSPGADIRHLQRIDSDNLSMYSEDAVPFRSSFTRPRPAKSSRPIPTMASRLKGKASYDQSHVESGRPSIASGIEQFKTPKSIMSGGTLFCTPGGSSDDPYPVAQTRYGPSHYPFIFDPS